MKRSRFFSLIAMAVGLSLLAGTVSAGDVNVYSYRKPKLIDPMFAVFTQKTGIKVNSVYAKKGMLERLQQEGSNSPADLVFTVDIGRLKDIQNAGLHKQCSPMRSRGISLRNLESLMDTGSV